MSESLSAEEVRKIAKLSRLAVSDEQVEQYRVQLSSILTYVDRLKQLDLAGVEPMTTVGDLHNRLDDDTPGPTISNETFIAIAPATMPPFIKVPKVLGEGGGA
jgi:aspartyl-tRNA(Asn)/glutamyl-tRNA(Gln) amidotransferase subunit C